MKQMMKNGIELRKIIKKKYTTVKKLCEFNRRTEFILKILSDLLKKS